MPAAIWAWRRDDIFNLAVFSIKESPSAERRRPAWVVGRGSAEHSRGLGDLFGCATVAVVMFLALQLVSISRRGNRKAVRRYGRATVFYSINQPDDLCGEASVKCSTEQEFDGPSRRAFTSASSGETHALFPYRAGLQARCPEGQAAITAEKAIKDPR